MDSAVVMSRLQFAFTISYHYLFPQFTMGLAFLIVVMKTIAIRRNDERYNQAVRFWSKIFAITFILGVVTGIPMEFQFGTNWAQFSTYAGNIIAQTLAMEGAFAFFLESAFVGLLLFGEQRFGQKVHWFAAVMVWLGTWASGFFIIASNAWMQHPVGYTPLPDGGGIKISDYWAVLFNSWIFPQYLHTMGGAVVTGAFVMAGLGAYYMLLDRHVEFGRIFVKVGVIVGVIASLLQLYPSGDLEGSQVALHQPTKLAAMEGLFHTTEGADVVIIGQPDTEKQTLDNAISIPRVLSFLTYRRWTATVHGLNEFPRDTWPDSIPLLYYSYHIMVGLGTIFIAIMALAALLLWRRKLWQTRWMLWLLMLAVPFPFIANTAGWFTTELGRQPWIIYDVLHTRDGVSTTVSSGNILFTLIGFAGMYLIMGLLYIVLMVQAAVEGPEAHEEEPDALPSMIG
ncbi:MAG TPA: cytochrome ubiquinol oxidase subunit I [Nitrolancea sp.]